MHSLLHKINPYISKTNQEPNIHEVREYIYNNDFDFKVDEDFIQIISSQTEKYKALIKQVFPNLKIDSIVHIGESSGVFKTENSVVKVAFDSNELNNVIYYDDFAIGPKLKGFGVVGKYDIMIFEKMDGDLFTLANANQNSQIDIKKVENLILKMHKLGIIHFDLHTKNILYKLVNDTYEYKICDFEHSRFYNTDFDYGKLKNRMKIDKHLKEFSSKEYLTSQCRELCIYDPKYGEHTNDPVLFTIAMRINSQ